MSSGVMFDSAGNGLLGSSCVTQLELVLTRVYWEVECAGRMARVARRVRIERDYFGYRRDWVPNLVSATANEVATCPESLGSTPVR